MYDISIIYISKCVCDAYIYIIYLKETINKISVLICLTYVFYFSSTSYDLCYY